MSAVECFTLARTAYDEQSTGSGRRLQTLARFAKIGLVPGQDFDATQIELRILRSASPKLANDRIMIQFKINKAVKDINGFAYTTKTGAMDTPTI